MGSLRIGRDGRKIEMGGGQDIPRQIDELLDDIRHLSSRLLVIAHAVGIPDVHELGDFPEVLEEIPNLRQEIDDLDTRVDALANDVREDFRDLSQRVSAIEARLG
jgi:cell division septum initiation protein DivIVA